MEGDQNRYLFRDGVAVKVEAVHMHKGDIVCGQSTFNVALVGSLNRLADFVSDCPTRHDGSVQPAEGLRVCMGDHNGSIVQRTNGSFELCEQDLCPAYSLRPYGCIGKGNADDRGLA